MSDHSKIHLWFQPGCPQCNAIRDAADAATEGTPSASAIDATMSTRDGKPCMTPSTLAVAYMLEEEAITLRAELAKVQGQRDKIAAAGKAAIEGIIKTWKELDEARNIEGLREELIQFRRENHDLRGVLAQAKEALMAVLNSATPHPVDNPSMTAAWAKAQAALAALSRFLPIGEAR